MSIIAEYLQNKSGLESDVIADVRYYVDAVVASIMAKQAHPTADQVAKLAVLVKTPIDVGLLENATKLVPCLSG